MYVSRVLKENIARPKDFQPPAEIALWVPFPQAMPQLPAALHVHRENTVALSGCRHHLAIVQLLPIRSGPPKMNHALHARQAHSAQLPGLLFALLALLDFPPQLAVHHVKHSSMHKFYW
jgi:hypothetical protein